MTVESHAVPTTPRWVRLRADTAFTNRCSLSALTLNGVEREEGDVHGLDGDWDSVGVGHWIAKARKSRQSHEPLFAPFAVQRPSRPFVSFVIQNFVIPTLPIIWAISWRRWGVGVCMD